MAGDQVNKLVIPDSSLTNSEAPPSTANLSIKDKRKVEAIIDPPSLTNKRKKALSKPSSSSKKQNKAVVARKGDDNDDDYVAEVEHNGAIGKVWTSKDEITLLQMLKLQEDKRNTKGFYDIVRRHLDKDMTFSQVSEKVRRLKRRFKDISKKGGGYDFVNDHELKIFNLCGDMWGDENEERSADGNNVKEDMDGNPGHWSFQVVFPNIDAALDHVYKIEDANLGTIRVLRENLNMLPVERLVELDDEWILYHDEVMDIEQNKSALLRKQAKYIQKAVNLFRAEVTSEHVNQQRLTMTNHENDMVVPDSPLIQKDLPAGSKEVIRSSISSLSDKRKQPFLTTPNYDFNIEYPNIDASIKDVFPFTKFKYSREFTRQSLKTLSFDELDELEDEWNAYHCREIERGFKLTALVQKQMAMIKEGNKLYEEASTSKKK